MKTLETIFNFLKKKTYTLLYTLLFSYILSVKQIFVKVYK